MAKTSMSFSVNFAIASLSPVRMALNGILVFHSGCCRRHRSHPIEGKQYLRVDGLLDPGRPVLVEGGDAVLGRNELRIVLVGGGFDEVEDRLLRRAIVP